MKEKNEAKKGGARRPGNGLRRDAAATGEEGTATDDRRHDEMPRVHTEEPEVEQGKGPKVTGPDLRVREDPEDARRRQDAYDAEFEWNGEVLKPYTSSRDGVFGQLRLAMGAPPLPQCFADTEAFYADAVRILWLCSHGPMDWNRLRQNPVALQSAIDEWGDKNVDGGQKGAASHLALMLYLAAQANRHEAAPAAGASRRGARDEGN